MDVDKYLPLFTIGIAIWGAITGTLALLIQYRQHQQDKTELRLSPKMFISSSITGTMIDVMEMIDFEVAVVNTGRRVARLEEVGIAIAGRQKLKDHHGLNVIVFDSRVDGVITLEEGEKHVFELRRWPKTLEEMAEYFDAKETAYVRLTSGKVFREEFGTVSMSKLAEIRKRV